MSSQRNRSNMWIINSAAPVALVIFLLAMAIVYSLDTEMKINVLPALVSSLVSPKSFSRDYTVAVWEWRSPTQFDHSRTTEIVDYCATKGVDVIFLRIDEYIDIYEQQGGIARDQSLQRFDSALAYFVSEATRKGIRVYGLAGNPRWVLDSHRYVTDRLTRFALDYNERHSPEEVLSGIQFDIEPYTLPDYNEKSAGMYLNSLIETVDLVADIVASSSQRDTFDLGFALPYWYDSSKAVDSSTSWRGVTRPVFFHIADRLSELSRSHVAIMAYRNDAEGYNGSIELSQDELAYIQAHTYTTRVFIGQELNRVEPSSISFASFRWKKFIDELGKIYGAYRLNRSFAGFALNDLDALQKLYP